jgi:hypothetical protein
LGIVLEALADSNNVESVNFYSVGGNGDLSDPAGWTKPKKILDAPQLRKSKWYPQVVGTDAAKRETDKFAGKTARLFVAGTSMWEIVFSKRVE